MIKNIPEFLEHLYSEIRSQTDVAVIGLSGGADSTLVATLCMKALGKSNVYGISMPYGETDAKTFNMRSERLAERLEIKHHKVFIHRIVEMINDATQDVIRFTTNQACYTNNINAGNMRSRSRMCILYSVAWEIGNKIPTQKARVVGTGNLSEDWIGYDTKGGDALADFFPIGELFKSEVYQLLDYFKEQGVLTEDLIDRVPSAGLWQGQTDEGELGYSYNEMEPAIRCILTKDTRKEPIEVTEKFEKVLDFVYNRHQANKHKHEAPPVIKLREFCD